MPWPVAGSNRSSLSGCLPGAQLRAGCQRQHHPRGASAE